MGNGMFAETEKVDYCLSFFEQGKQTSIFYLPFAENKQKCAVSVFHLQQTNKKLPFSVPFSVYIYTY
jgi:hypothetical protein